MGFIVMHMATMKAMKIVMKICFSITIQATKKVMKTKTGFVNTMEALKKIMNQ